MLNFVYDIPTKVYFGRRQIEVLPKVVAPFGNRILIVTYKKQSPSELAILQEAQILLDAAGISYWFYKGVDPNPLITSVTEGARLCHEYHVDLILAIGGGSAIDCAKAIAAAFYYQGDAWDLIVNNNKVTNALPIGCILTIAAAGSEMDHTAVISNSETREKLHLFSDLLFPRFSILDPVYTFTVPPFQTACGCADIITHAMEVYFANTPDTYVQNRMAEAMIKTVIHYTKPVLTVPCDYEARANIMWASTLAISSIMAHGKSIQWSSHYIEHTISAYYDIPHGAGMAVIFPVWLEYILSKETVANFTDFSVNVWGLQMNSDPFVTAKAGINALKEYFFGVLKLPSSLRELGVEKHMLETLAQSAVDEGPIKGTKLLLKENVFEILSFAY